MEKHKWKIHIFRIDRVECGASSNANINYSPVFAVTGSKAQNCNLLRALKLQLNYFLNYSIQTIFDKLSRVLRAWGG